MFIISAVNMFFQIIIYFILGRAVMSWFVRPGDRLYPLYMSVVRLTEPILMPCRTLMGRFGGNMGVDFSPLIALLAIYILQRLINGLLITLLF